jgi:hypothetical protein
MASIGMALDREWAQLVSSRDGTLALAEWKGRWAVFAGCRDLDDVLEQRRDPAAAQALLRPLALMAPSDAVAARTLLQALLPGLLALASSAGRDDPRALEELVALAWERIRTYPAHREGSVAGNVLLDVRKRYRRHRTIEAPTALPHEPWREPSVDQPDSLDAATAVGGLLSVAVQRGVIDRDELEVIVRSRMYDIPLAEVAVERGVSARRLGQQRWRAEERLRQMARAERAQLMPWSAA